MKDSPNQGFSLVEMMIVVGIIGILATMAMQMTRVFKIKAGRAEAYTLIKTFDSECDLLNQATSDSDNPYLCGPNSKEFIDPMSGNTSGKTTCHVVDPMDNPTRYYPPDCRKIRYWLSATSNIFIAVSTENVCPTVTEQLWFNFMCKEFCQPMDVAKSNCGPPVVNPSCDFAFITKTCS